MNWDCLTGEQKSKKKKVKKEFEINPLIPKTKKGNPKQIIEVHHFHHNILDQKTSSTMVGQGAFSKPKNKLRLSVLNGEMPIDVDGDGIPNALDPNPFRAEPKKKLIYEKALRSIYRDDKD